MGKCKVQYVKYRWILFLISVFVNFSYIHAQSDGSFQYKLDTKKEVFLLSGGTVVTGFSLILNSYKPHLSKSYIEGLNKDDLIIIDRPAANQWSESADHTSNILRTSILIAPVTLIIPQLLHKEYQNAFTLVTMYSEALLINGGITLLAKNSVNRPRPYLYNSSLTDDEKLKQKEPFSSFFSGHTSFSFCTAVFISKVFNDMYPDSQWRYVVWSGSLLAASTTAYLRYKSGMHYPTDLFVGAVVGSAIGFLIPEIHKSKITDDAVSQTAQSPIGFNWRMNFW
jgi:membrane-associated phospholipid phosphatase